MEALYHQADRMRLGPVRGGEALQVCLLNACLCLPYLLFDRYRYGIVQVLQKVLDLGVSPPADLADSIHLPRLYPIVHAAFLISILVPRSKLPQVLGCAVILFGTVIRLFDPLSALVLILFVNGLYLIMKGSWASRPWKLVILTVGQLLFMNACQLWSELPESVRRFSTETPVIVTASRFGAGFIPLIWYACYESCAGRLSYAKCQMYFFCRLLSATVFPVKDLCFDWTNRRHWQWRGVFTLGIAFIALSLRWHLERYLHARDPTWHTLSGPKLIGFSFCYFLSQCFGLVARFNMFIGSARLLGIPIRSAFYFWLLARTPNERWRRWNMLIREWIITYVFYPMMRAKRGLFLSIMATLLMSGVIHLFGILTPERFDSGRVGRVLLYWTLNGLAIYVVVVIPRKFPALMDRLRIRKSVVWSCVGIVTTWLFYSILFVLRDKCLTPGDMASYLQRLTGA